MLSPEEIQALREVLGEELARKLAPIDLVDWIDERYENAKRIAKTKTGQDRQGWLEDACYFLRAREALKQLAMASGDEHLNVPLRMHIALRIMRAWNSGTAGYSADVVIAVNDWIDGGMKGPLPWPDNPFFAEWAEQAGYAKIGAYVGFKFQAQITQRTGPANDKPTANTTSPEATPEEPLSAQEGTR